MGPSALWSHLLLSFSFSPESGLSAMEKRAAQLRTVYEFLSPEQHHDITGDEGQGGRTVGLLAAPLFCFHLSGLFVDWYSDECISDCRHT